MIFYLENMSIDVLLFRLEFTGGGGETHTSGQEAIALALKVNQDQIQSQSLRRDFGRGEMEGD